MHPLLAKPGAAQAKSCRSELFEGGSYIVCSFDPAKIHVRKWHEVRRSLRSAGCPLLTHSKHLKDDHRRQAQHESHADNIGSCGKENARCGAGISAESLQGQWHEYTEETRSHTGTDHSEQNDETEK